VIDCHLHLDESIPGPALNAAKFLVDELSKNNVKKGVLLHLERQRWSLEEVGQAIEKNSRHLIGFANINPMAKEGPTLLKQCIKEYNFKGLKLHPRLQNYSIEDPRTLKLVQLAGELNIPILIDAFPDGDWIMQGFSPLSFAGLAKKCPKTRIIIAHMGGHYVLDMMMLAKKIPNLYFDFSFSLLYYRKSSVIQDMMYAMGSMRYERIFYGSDYPDRSIAETLKLTLEIFRKEKLDQSVITCLMVSNAKEFFKWPDV